MTKSRRKELNKILKQYFGYDELKDLQYKVIKSILGGNDTIALFPTAYGKSICYQLPHLITKKNVIVVSPLISLMEDQTRELANKNIGAICLNSTNKQKNSDLNNIYEGNTKIIYTTPEYLINNPDFVENMIFTESVCLIAIDECHCVSSWGHSFRSDYQKLSYLKLIAKNVPILAMTATATQKIIDDVSVSLNLINPKKYKYSIDRPKLFISIQPRDSKTIENKIIPLILEELSKGPECGKILIYCKTRKDTDKVADKISEYGLDCKAYHSEKPPDEKTTTQKNYTTGNLNIICATIAFGMGINIPNIRLMIHYNCSNDIESYVQEIGRAGRDDKNSKCYMFYSNQDFIMNHNFLEDIKDENMKNIKEEGVNYLKKFVTTSECRRSCLLKYFDEEMKSCNNCDNCLANKNEKNFTDEAHLLFSLMLKFNNNFGLGTYVKLLIGSKDKQIKKYADMIGDLYGKGSMYSENIWKKIIDIFYTNGYLIDCKIKTQSFMSSVTKISQKGLLWYKMATSGKKEELVFNIPVELHDLLQKNQIKKAIYKNVDELDHTKSVIQSMMKIN